VSLAAKYGDLLGRPVADDLDNYVITHDWMSVFDVRWRKSTPNKSFKADARKRARPERGR
jgi:hypothetical protein